MGVRVRPLEARDRTAWLGLRSELWPKTTAAEHAAEVDARLRGERVSTLPSAVFVAELDGRVVGFVETGLRSHADGCDPHWPVGYLEGWYVAPGSRMHGIGGALVRAAEDWARGQGCREMASDTWLEAGASLEAHKCLGYGIVEFAVHFRKLL
jgi:aminoglycoside 6'-N-acetyltransferase I